MRATAQSENAARALGINLAGTRTLAFVISAGFAGLAGGLYTFLNLFVNYETFTFFHSISFLLMVMLGGVGTLAGPILGTCDPHLRRGDPAGPEGVADFRLRRAAAARDVRDAVRHRRHDEPLYGVLSTRSRGANPARGRTGTSRSPTSCGRRATDTDVALATEGLTLRFGGLTAVDDVRIQVRPGTVHALIGPNGAGKSSLLNLISGFYTPTDGAISFFGQSIAGQPSYALARLGIARTFQNTELFGQMTVEENVLAGFTRTTAARWPKRCCGCRGSDVKSARSLRRRASC